MISCHNRPTPCTSKPCSQHLRGLSNALALGVLLAHGFLHESVCDNDGLGASFLELPPCRDSVFCSIDVAEVDQSVHRGIVEVIVEHSPPPVFDGILDGSHDDDDDKGHGVQGRIRGAKNLEDLQDEMLALH